MSDKLISFPIKIDLAEYGGIDKEEVADFVSHYINEEIAACYEHGENFLAQPCFDTIYFDCSENFQHRHDIANGLGIGEFAANTIIEALESEENSWLKDYKFETLKTKPVVAVIGTSDKLLTIGVKYDSPNN